MEEKLAFLKREEIRTMAKDLARLQEETALQEKERISQLRVEEKLKREAAAREKIASTMIPKGLGIKEETIPKPPTKKAEWEEPLLPKAKRPSSLEKILVRIIIVLFSLGFFLLITFGYWFFIIKRKSPEASPPPSAVATPSPPSEVEGPSPSAVGVIPPIPILAVKEIKILRITPEKDFKNLLSESLANVLPSGSSPEFFELIPQKNDQFLNLQDVLDEVGIKSPEGFRELVSGKADDFDFFLYSKGAGEQRLGFVVKLGNDEIAPGGVKERTTEMLKAWEKTMESDWVNFSRILGQEKPSLTSVFKQTSYSGAFFRCLSFQERNLGICWSVLDNYLIITSSGESIIKTIDLVRN
ncbi:MAG: hypothetical protein Q8N65_02045 [bacterium]|nr:hypothetical protein [bacterium]